MKIVVIGGNGLIGSKLVTKLREHGRESIAASRNSGVYTLKGEGLAVFHAGRHLRAPRMKIQIRQCNGFLAGTQAESTKRMVMGMKEVSRRIRYPGDPPRHIRNILWIGKLNGFTTERAS